MPASPTFLITFLLTLAAMAWLALAGGRGVKVGSDFSLAGRRAGAWSVSGAIMGTLVGGASTIGTAQLAFLFGLSAWWFTLGAGIACLLLGLFLAGPLREKEVETIPQFIGRYHGERARVAASLFSSLGMFVHIVAQLLAGGAILSTLFGFGLLPATLISAALIGLAVLAGGMKGAGSFGLAKLFLLYLTMAGAGVLAWRLAGGWSGLRTVFPPSPWFSLFGYGVREGVNDLLSMLVGVISTQTYLQAVFSARDRRAARDGALLSALIIPPLGLFGIAVGLYMRQVDPSLESVKALPAFLQAEFSPLFAGAAFATLLIAAVGTGAGLTLGVATTLRVDVFGRLGLGRLPELTLYRLLTLAVLVLALLLVLGNLGSAIMDWSFLSMGLRGATLCLPLLAAVFLGSATPRRAGALSIILAPTCVLAAGIAGWQTIPPLYLGLGVSLTILLVGWWGGRWPVARS
ncbi:MAG: sodium:solute symporter family protein [Desulfuromonadales bacterium]|nr:sodium:solute symporter family protein [Desulfuromonadales bacterium]